jgi:hypothetical protein
MPGPWKPFLSGRPRKAEDLVIIERTPALVRTVSGAIFHDDFSTDTESLYIHGSGPDYWAISGGNMVCTTINPGDNCIIRDSTENAKVATIRYKSTVIGNYTYTLVLGGHGIFGDYYSNGYYLYNQSATYRLMGVVGGGVLDNETISALSNDTWYYMRLIIDDGVVSGKFGQSALADTGCSAADTTYSCGHVALSNYEGTTTFDFLDARTGHEVIVTGLPSGYYAQVSDGTTTAKAAASSGTATVDAGLVLFPLARVSVYNGDPDSGGTEVAYITSTEITDMGGGDEFSYAENPDFAEVYVGPWGEPSTLGYTGSGTHWGEDLSTGNLYGCKYTLAENGWLQSMTAYMKNDGASSQQCRFAVYANNAGAMGALLGATETITLPTSFTEQWVTLRFSAPIYVTSQEVWLIVYAGLVNSNMDLAFLYPPVTTAWYKSGSETFPTLPDPGGAWDGEYTTRQFSVYLTYATQSWQDDGPFIDGETYYYRTLRDYYGTLSEYSEEDIFEYTTVDASILTGSAAQIVIPEVTALDGGAFQLTAEQVGSNIVISWSAW